MSIDFLNTECKESVRNNSVYGICDNQDGTKAYTNIANESSWVATVENTNQLETVFTPIDNCIIIMKNGTKDEESTCDGMLTFRNSIYLIELKEQRTGGWLPDAIGQLENTIKLIEKANNIDDITFKKAYACNKKHPNFQVIDVERKRRFFDETGFRIDAQAKIVVK